jgi:serine/threonine-protein kinase HipA
MYLASDGALLPSVCRPFTHILKPAGTSGFDILPVIEWQALTLGAAAGFETPAMALVAIPDMPPALIVERLTFAAAATTRVCLRSKISRPY